MPWPVYDAKARFSEFLDTTLKDGPQIVTRRGVETAVLVPIDEWKHLNQSARRNVPDPLLNPLGPRNIPLPPQRLLLKPRAVRFEDSKRA